MGRGELHKPAVYFTQKDCDAERRAAVTKNGLSGIGSLKKCVAYRATKFLTGALDGRASGKDIRRFPSNSLRNPSSSISLLLRTIFAFARSFAMRSARSMLTGKAPVGCLGRRTEITRTEAVGLRKVASPHGCRRRA